MFLVKQGTPVKVHDERTTGRFTYDTRDSQAKRDLVFDVEQIAIDPVGRVGCHRGYVKTVGGAWAGAGWYGFQFNEHITVLVKASAVTVL